MVTIRNGISLLLQRESRCWFGYLFFRKSGYKMLLGGGETLNDEKHLCSLTPHHQTGSITQPGGHYGSGYMKDNLGQNPWNLEGRALSALSRFGENARVGSDPVWLHRAQQQHAIRNHPVSASERPMLSSILSNKGLPGALFLVGEVLFITRPLIYVLFIRKFGIRSWIPWFFSLVVDFIGVSFLSLVTTFPVDRREKVFHLSAQKRMRLRDGSCYSHFTY